MIRRLLVAVAIGALCGCGADCPPLQPDAGPEPLLPLDSRIDGTWHGSMHAVGEDGRTADYTSTLTIEHVGDADRLLVGLCAGERRPMRLSGAGVTAYWTGVITCAPAPFMGCQNSVLAYSAVEIELLDSEYLFVKTTGVADGCGRRTLIEETVAAHR